jgi:hypothetical protein
METDLRRWSDQSKLSEQWAERAKVVAGWIPEGAHVGDIGCGRMAVEGLLRGGGYHPLDVVRRDERTVVVDLNTAAIPEHFLARIDHATLLGVLEYLVRPEDLLRRLSAAGITLVCSYQLADFSSPEVRGKNGWFNAYNAAEFPRLLRRCGFEIDTCRLHDSQGLYLARPGTPKFRPPAPPQRAGGRGRLVLSGFFGRGNVGDEAILQVQYERLSPHFDITISVEERGAHEGFWNWYPYNQCPIIHHANTDAFRSEDVVGLHVGGGELRFGFNGGQILAALAAGKTVCMSGIEGGDTFHEAARNNPRLLRGVLAEVALIAARSEESHRFFAEWSERASRGADWACKLECDQSPDAKSGLTLVVLREFPPEHIRPAYRESVARLIRCLQGAGHEVALFPFCPEDERFQEHLEATWGTPCERHWWNPRRIKQMIRQARMVVSVGRLHPLIFAASVGTPCVFADLATDVGTWRDGRIGKARMLCSEFGLAYLPSFGDLCDWLERGETPAARSFPPAYDALFEAMVRGVVDAFAARPAPRHG